MIRVEYIGLKEAIAACKRTEGLRLADVYGKFYFRHFLPKLKERYDRAAAATPYSPRSLGTRKSSGAIRGGGGDLGFGRDRDRMYSDLAGGKGKEITRQALAVFSAQAYAPYIEALFSAKGPFKPDGVLAADNSDLDAFEGIVRAEIDRLFGG